MERYLVLPNSLPNETGVSHANPSVLRAAEASLNGRGRREESQPWPCCVQ